MAPHDPTPEPTGRAFLDRRARAEIHVARRYLEHGFVDASLRIFVRRAEHVAPDDWSRLVARLLERGRMADAVDVCQRGGIPLPRQELLAMGDRELRRKDLDTAIHYYELAGADAERWSGLVDVLIRLPGRELQATEIAERHLIPRDARITAAA